MDAGRLGMRAALPRAFLEAAAPGYLTDTEWDLHWTPDWLEKGLGDATDATQVRALHLRERELSGYSWYSRESSGQASLVADAAVFEFRMAGLAAGGGVRHAVVDRVAEGILAEAREWDADLIVLGSPRRGEFTARLFGSVTQRVLQRSACPVIVAPQQAGGRRKQLASAAASEPPASP